MKIIFIISIITIAVFQNQAYALNSQACMNDVLTLAQNLQSLKSDLSTLNVTDIQSQITSLEVDVSKIKSDCFAGIQLELSPIACIKDIQQAVTQVEQLLADVKTGDTNMNDYFGLITQLITLFTKLETDCSTSLKFKFMDLLKINPTSCIADVTSFVQTLEKFESDLQSQNIQDILSQITVLEGEIPQIKTDCLSTYALGLSPIACVKDLYTVVVDAEKIMGEIKAGDINIGDYYTQVQVLIVSAKKAMTDCSNKQQFQMTPQSCVTDVESLVSTLVTLESDLKNDNILDIITQITNLQKQIPLLKNDCLSIQNQLVFNPIACVQDVQQVLVGAEKLITEIKAGDTDMNDYLTQVQLLITSVKQAKTDCAESVNKKFLN